MFGILKCVQFGVFFMNRCRQSRTTLKCIWNKIRYFCMLSWTMNIVNFVISKLVYNPTRVFFDCFLWHFRNLIFLKMNFFMTILVISSLNWKVKPVVKMMMTVTMQTLRLKERLMPRLTQWQMKRSMVWGGGVVSPFNPRSCLVFEMTSTCL